MNTFAVVGDVVEIGQNLQVNNKFNFLFSLFIFSKVKLEPVEKKSRSSLRRW